MRSLIVTLSVVEGSKPSIKTFLVGKLSLRRESPESEQRIYVVIMTAVMVILQREHIKTNI